MLFLPIKIALIADESFEALRALRNTRLTQDAQTAGVAVEIMDAIVRALDLLAYLEVDVDSLYAGVLDANRARKHRHGEKAF